MVISLLNKVRQLLTSSIKKEPRPIEQQLELPPYVKASTAFTSQYPSFARQSKLFRLEQDTVSAKDSAIHSLQLRLLFSTEQPEAKELALTSEAGELSKAGKDDE